MNKGGNRVQIPLVLFVVPHKNEQIKNLGKFTWRRDNKEISQFSLNVGVAIGCVD